MHGCVITITCAVRKTGVEIIYGVRYCFKYIAAVMCRDLMLSVVVMSTVCK